MSTIDLLGADGAKGGTVELPDDLFDVTTNIPLIHQVVTAQLAAARQGTHATKTRGLVSGGGKKPWRQKGTGRARQGSRRAPQWVGGGTVHGPQPRDYHQRTPKQMVQAALLGALSDRAREGRVLVVDAIVEGDVPSTKKAAAVLSAITDYTNVLVVLDRDDFVGWLSLRNLPTAHVIAADQLNAYDVVVCDAVVFTKAAIELFAAAKGATVTVKQKAAAKKTEPAAKKAPAKAAEEEVAEEIADAPAAVVDEIKEVAKEVTEEVDELEAKAFVAETTPAKKVSAKAVKKDEAEEAAIKAEAEIAEAVHEEAAAPKKPAAKKPAAKKPAAEKAAEEDTK